MIREQKNQPKSMRLLAVPLFRQSPSQCGPAALKMVLDYYGKRLSEKAISLRSRTSLKFGTTPANLLSAAKSYGLTGQWMRQASIRDLRRWFDSGVPTIVNWFSINEGHYSVVIGVDKTSIVLADPETGKRREFSHQEFMAVWFHHPFPWIRKPSELRIRWALPLWLSE